MQKITPYLINQIVKSISNAFDVDAQSAKCLAAYVLGSAILQSSMNVHKVKLKQGHELIKEKVDLLFEEKLGKEGAKHFFEVELWNILNGSVVNEH